MCNSIEMLNDFYNDMISDQSYKCNRGKTNLCETIIVTIDVILINYVVPGCNYIYKYLYRKMGAIYLKLSKKI